MMKVLQWVQGWSILQPRAASVVHALHKQCEEEEPGVKEHRHNRKDSWMMFESIWGSPSEVGGTSEGLLGVSTILHLTWELLHFVPICPVICSKLVHFSLLLLSHQVMSDSLQPHGLRRARLPCPSLSPRVCPNSCPLSQWCPLTISSSVSPSPPALNLSQHQSLFQWVGSSHQADWRINNWRFSFFSLSYNLGVCAPKSFLCPGTLQPCRGTCYMELQWCLAID